MTWNILNLSSFHQIYLKYIYNYTIVLPYGKFASVDTNRQPYKERNTTLHCHNNLVCIRICFFVSNNSLNVLNRVLREHSQKGQIQTTSLIQVGHVLYDSMVWRRSVLCKCFPVLKNVFSYDCHKCHNYSLFNLIQCSFYTTVKVITITRHFNVTPNYTKKVLNYFNQDKHFLLMLQELFRPLKILSF